MTSEAAAPAIPSGTRTPSSTSCTSRRSSTATTMASATFAGLLHKLDYLQDLGVTCLWLLPFFPSRCATMATTFRTTATSIPSTVRWEEFQDFLPRRTRAGCRS